MQPDTLVEASFEQRAGLRQAIYINTEANRLRYAKSLRRLRSLRKSIYFIAKSAHEPRSCPDVRQHPENQRARLGAHATSMSAIVLSFLARTFAYAQRRLRSEGALTIEGVRCVRHAKLLSLMMCPTSLTSIHGGRGSSSAATLSIAPWKERRPWSRFRRAM